LREEVSPTYTEAFSC